MKFVLKPLMTGIIALLPVGLTLGILAWLASLMAQLFGPASYVGTLFRKIGWNFGSSETGAYLGGVLFTVFLVYLLGVLVQLGLRGSWDYVNQWGNNVRSQGVRSSTRLWYRRATEHLPVHGVYSAKQPGIPQVKLETAQIC